MAETETTTYPALERLARDAVNRRDRAYAKVDERFRQDLIAIRDLGVSKQKIAKALGVPWSKVDGWMDDDGPIT